MQDIFRDESFHDFGVDVEVARKMGQEVRCFTGMRRKRSLFSPAGKGPANFTENVWKRLVIGKRRKVRYFGTGLASWNPLTDWTLL